MIGFSFYGDINSDYSKKKGYFEGIVGNLELMPKYYPGWTMRLYYDLDKSDPVFKDLCELACKNDILDICNAKDLPGTPFVDSSKVFAMNWRFFPTLDPQVSLNSKVTHAKTKKLHELCCARAILIRARDFTKPLIRFNPHI